MKTAQECLEALSRMNRTSTAAAQARTRSAKPRRCTCGGCTCCQQAEPSLHRRWRIAVSDFYRDFTGREDHYFADDAVSEGFLMVLMSLGASNEDADQMAPSESASAPAYWQTLVLP